MPSDKQRIILIRRDDILRNILVRALRIAGFDVRVYLPGTSPWVIPADGPSATIFHVPVGLEEEAQLFFRQLVSQELPRPPLFFHAEMPQNLEERIFRSNGVEVVPAAAPLSLLMERVWLWLGREEARAAGLLEEKTGERAGLIDVN